MANGSTILKATKGYKILAQNNLMKNNIKLVLNRN
jgi:hypothetical protein